MSEPTRLLEQGATPVERALLDAAVAERPGPRLRRRAIAALGLLYVAPRAASAATPMSAGAAAGASGKLMLAQVAKWCLVLGLGGGVVAGWQSLSGSDDPAAPLPGQGTTEVLATAPQDEMSNVAPAQREQPAEDDTDSKDDTARSRRSPAAKSTQAHTPGRSPAPAAPSAPDTSRSVRDQVALLDHARLWLSRGAPQRALATLSKYRARYPQGVLREEASVLRIEALRALGDREQEQAELRRFSRRFPRSAHTERVKSGR